MRWASPRPVGEPPIEQNGMNQPNVSDWVVQVPLWPSGLGIGLWNQWPGIIPYMVSYTGGSGNPGLPEWKLPALVDSGLSQEAQISKRGE